MRNVRLLAALSALLFSASALAATQIRPTDISAPTAHPYYGRTDGIVFDNDTKAPGIAIDGTIDAMLNSSLYVSVDSDFLGYFIIPDVDTDDAAQSLWNSQDAATAGCPARVGDADDGQIELLLDNGSEVGDCTLYWGDEQNIDSDTEPFCIFRVQVEATPAAADTVSWGLMDGRNALLESVSHFAAFSVTGADLTLDTESDDNSTDVGKTGTGVTLTAATYYEFLISLNSMHGVNPQTDPDGGSATDVKFFYRSTLGGDWTQLNSTTTFSVGADVALQPFVQVEKTNGTTTPGVKVDRIVCAWERS